MPLEITLAGTPIPTDSAAVKDLISDLNLAFNVEKTLQPYLNSALSLVPATGKSSIVYTSPAVALKPVGSLVEFGLQGNASGSLEVVNSGDLVTYTDGLSAPASQIVAVPAGHAYLRLILNFTLSANASAKYSGGAYGVTAAANTEDTYAITFCKAFAPTTKLIDAIGATFASFVLPFTPRTLKNLADGDYLLHEFDGNMHFAMGAYAGLDKVLYAGQGTADVLQTFGSPLATFAASVKPEIKLAAAMDFKLTYAAQFEALLSRTGDAGKLHLFKSTRKSSSTTLSAGLTIDLNAAASVEEGVTAHLDELRTTIVKAAGGAGTPGGDAVNTVLITQESKLELQKYVDEATDKLTGWLNRANGLKANLEVAIESTQARTLLAGYTFDLSEAASANFDEAWGFAIKGDLFEALATGFVTPDVGSGLEKEYQTKTSFQCNFFGLWHMSSWSQFSSSVSMVYAGNNVFHMLAHVGRSTETDYVGAMHSMDIYFSASADAKADGTALNSAVSLNIAMNAQNDPKAAESIALMLNGIDRSQAIATAVTNLRAFNAKTGNVQLLIKITPAAFQNIQCETKYGPHDETNWNAFAKAADDLNAWPLRSMSAVSTQMLQYLKTYDAWEDLNMAQSGASKPDRNQVGALNSWPQDWLGIDASWRPTIVYSMWAAQSFMNFSSALHDLASLQTVDAVSPSWESMLKLITKAVKDDLKIDFLRPAALATLRLCKGSTYALTAPAGPAIPMDHFAVSVVL